MPVTRKQREALGRQLRAKRIAKGLSFAEMAKLAGIPNKTTYSRIETGEGKLAPQFAAALAEITGIPMHELLFLPASVVVAPPNGKQSRIPVLDYSEVTRLSDEKISLSDLKVIAHTELPFDLEHPLMTFALKVLDDSMSPRLKQGDIALVDLGAYAKISDGSVVAAITKEGTPVLREYRLKRMGFELVAIKTGEVVDLKDDGVTLLGKVIKSISDM
jgi:transcriptional regulator with XRE-family HTH domain